MSHAPSRTPLPHPLSAASLQAFTSPRCRVFSRVLRDAATGTVMVANGCIALRVTRGPVTFDDSLPPASDDFKRRLDRLPWARFGPEHQARRMRPAPWASFDSIRGDLYRYGLEELWLPDGRMTKDKPVWTGDGMHIPLAILQLVARLPRCEACINRAHDYLLIRFTGGEGMIANRYLKVRGGDVPPLTLTIFQPRGTDGLPGGLV
ncbi:hypothetical protein OKA04_23345 [Luteolibacter flavescens]|uniref:Uncharacterized protein n=1 Tax=Luteolibacter flavescens TaxID=1859460 RepID=A0ABT3FWB4_9BACT|nr:hypothetical protein [Luteolibacter flavescens]MCW1887692.1 hypothetical protein [Luteolibacter flavescens]